jgi:hypothetical protein
MAPPNDEEVKQAVPQEIALWFQKQPAEVFGYVNRKPNIYIPTNFSPNSGPITFFVAADRNMCTSSRLTLKAEVYLTGWGE